METVNSNALYALRMERSEIDESEFTETELGILDMLAEGRCTPAYIAEELDVSAEYVRGRLGDLKRLGLVEKVHRGLYELADE
jgi:Mn-dependent DtxR family transcriptional regulator